MIGWPIVHLQDISTLNYITHNTLVLSYLHEVLFHVVSHELHNLLLTAQLLREGTGLEGEVFVVGQAVVHRPKRLETHSNLVSQHVERFD